MMQLTSNFELWTDMGKKPLDHCIEWGVHLNVELSGGTERDDLLKVKPEVRQTAKWNMHLAVFVPS